MAVQRGLIRPSLDHDDHARLIPAHMGKIGDSAAF